MESHAPPGAIQVTERTYRRLEDGFVLERRTGVVVKGKGKMTTYVLPRGAAGALGRRDALRAGQLQVTEARRSVVVDEPGGLHERVAGVARAGTSHFATRSRPVVHRSEQKRCAYRARTGLPPQDANRFSSLQGHGSRGR